MAEAVARGEPDAHQKNDRFVADACNALSILNGAGFQNLIIPAQLLVEALELVGKDQLLLACQAKSG